jgi:NitT/TauT family transport system substrate-binding protein
MVRCLLPTAYCLLVLLVACEPAKWTPARQPERGRVLRISVQGGIGYAPLLVMRKHRLLEQRVPELHVEWSVIPGAETIEEALAMGDLDLATGTATAFLQARERGVPARILAGVAELPIGLTTTRPETRSLRDFRPGDRIGVPALDGHEHTVLRMAALRELGDWQALDPLVVARPHAEASAALVGGRDIVGHVTIPPFLDDELTRPGVRRLIGGYEATGGPMTTVVAYTMPSLRERQPALYDIFLAALRDAVDLATRDVEGTARLLAEAEGPDGETPRFVHALARPGLVFSTHVRGLDRLVTFMRYTGQVKTAPTSWDELTFQGVRPGEVSR